METIKIKSEQTIELTLDQLAECLSGISDDDMAQLFCKVAKLAEGWGCYRREIQWTTIGRHLATCECSTEEGREMIRTIAAAMEDGSWSSPRK